MKKRLPRAFLRERLQELFEHHHLGLLLFAVLFCFLFFILFILGKAGFFSFFFSIILTQELRAIKGKC